MRLSKYLPKDLNNRIMAIQRAMESEKIERYAGLIARISLTNDIPDDMTPKEFAEIALWDRIGSRAGEIEEELRKQMGVTAIIDSGVALAPKGDND
jgi:hypothetical protein